MQRVACRRFAGIAQKNEIFLKGKMQAQYGFVALEWFYSTAWIAPFIYFFLSCRDSVNINDYSRKAIARVNASIPVTPALLSIFAHSCNVEPVVKTSSIRSIVLPATCPGLLTLKAPFRLFLRALPLRLVWGMVGRWRWSRSE